MFFTFPLLILSVGTLLVYFTYKNKTDQKMEEMSSEILKINEEKNSVEVKYNKALSDLKKHEDFKKRKDLDEIQLLFTKVNMLDDKLTFFSTSFRDKLDSIISILETEDDYAESTPQASDVDLVEQPAELEKIELNETIKVSPNTSIKNFAGSDGNSSVSTNFQSIVENEVETDEEVNNSATLDTAIDGTMEETDDFADDNVSDVEMEEVDDNLHETPAENTDIPQLTSKNNVTVGTGIASDDEYVQLTEDFEDDAEAENENPSFVDKNKLNDDSGDFDINLKEQLETDNEDTSTEDDYAEDDEAIEDGEYMETEDDTETYDTDESILDNNPTDTASDLSPSNNDMHQSETTLQTANVQNIAQNNNEILDLETNDVQEEPTIEEQQYKFTTNDDVLNTEPNIEPENINDISGAYSDEQEPVSSDQQESVSSDQVNPNSNEQSDDRIAYAITTKTTDTPSVDQHVAGQYPNNGMQHSVDKFNTTSTDTELPKNGPVPQDDTIDSDSDIISDEELNSALKYLNDINFDLPDDNDTENATVNNNTGINMSNLEAELESDVNEQRNASQTANVQNNTNQYSRGQTASIANNPVKAPDVPQASDQNGDNVEPHFNNESGFDIKESIEKLKAQLNDNKNDNKNGDNK